MVGETRVPNFEVDPEFVRSTLVRIREKKKYKIQDGTSSKPAFATLLYRMLFSLFFFFFFFTSRVHVLHVLHSVLAKNKKKQRQMAENKKGS